MADMGPVALPFLDPGTWRLWKTQLLAGQDDAAVARATGTHLGRLSRATRDRPDLARRFDTLDLFFKLRLDPYLLQCVRRHPDRTDPPPRWSRPHPGRVTPSSTATSAA
jgi:hypothetical protein